MRRLNLRMFDGEGSAATGAEAAAPETTEGQQAEQTPEEREKAFNDMINGDFRDLFDARMQKAIKERVGEVKQLQQQLQQQNDVIGLVAKNMAYLQTRWAIFAKLWKVTMYSGKKPLRIRA